MKQRSLPSPRSGRRGPDATPPQVIIPVGLEKRVVGNVSLLLPAPRAAAKAIGDCLAELRQEWQREGHLAALWQAWPRLAGPQLAPHCRPLSLVGGVLTVGAAPGPWLQGLTYTRHQLLGTLRGAGFPVRDVRVRQHYDVPLPPAAGEMEADVWARHPSRVDVHGLSDCPSCRRPAPTGEMALWGLCSFCHRGRLAERFSGR
jgi:predicted nucleic acid-binding Zn ribbon protein